MMAWCATRSRKGAAQVVRPSDRGSGTGGTAPSGANRPTMPRQDRATRCRETASARHAVYAGAAGVRPKPRCHAATVACGVAMPARGTPVARNRKRTARGFRWRGQQPELSSLRRLEAAPRLRALALTIPSEPGRRRSTNTPFARLEPALSGPKRRDATAGRDSTRPPLPHRPSPGSKIT